MGSFYLIHELKCPFCERTMDEVYYQPSANIETVTCKVCGKESRIIMEFKLEKVEDES